jgi:hypothetical protein
VADSLNDIRWQTNFKPEVRATSRPFCQLSLATHSLLTNSESWIEKSACFLTSQPNFQQTRDLALLFKVCFVLLFFVHLLLFSLRLLICLAYGISPQ